MRPRIALVSPLFEIPLLLLTGVIAGIINTIAGGGSFLTLPALMALGLSPAIANGTNRVAVVVQAVVGAGEFHRSARVDYRWVRLLAPPLIAGSVVGAFVATVLETRHFERVFGVLLIAMGALTLLKSRLFRTASRGAPASPLVVLPVFVVIGLFGGFIQAGVGILLVSAMMLLLKVDAVVANSIKLLLVLLLTVPALLVFIMQGQVEFVPGLILSVGNAFGAWLGVRIALRIPNWVVLVVIGCMATVTGMILLF